MKRSALITIFIYVLSYLGVVWFVSYLRPAADDWGYFTTPQFSLVWNDLLPRGSFWRPLDVLFGRLLGFFPGAFPLLNHAFVALGYSISLYLLTCILRKLVSDGKSRLISVFFFALSPGIVATLYSVDSLNQSWALTFGALGTVMYLKGSNILYKLAWIFCSFLAVLSKESGIVWFIATPLIGFLVHTSAFNDVRLSNQTFRNAVKNIGLAVVFILLYFFIRVVLLGNSDGFNNSTSEERYHLTIFSIGFIRNILLILSTSITSIDSVAILLQPANKLLFLITLLFNILFLFFLFSSFLKKVKSRNLYRITGFIVVAFIVSSPHLLIAQSAEMHGYPTVFIAAIILALLLDSISWNKFALVAISCYFGGAIITDIHKWNLMYKYGKSGEKIALTLLSQTKVIPENVLLVMVEDDRPGYSIFWQNPLMAFYYGRAMKPYYNWEYPKQIAHTTLQKNTKKVLDLEIDKIVSENLAKFDCIWVINGDEIKTLYKN